MNKKFICILALGIVFVAGTISPAFAAASGGRGIIVTDGNNSTCSKCNECSGQKCSMTDPFGDKINGVCHSISDNSTASGRACICQYSSSGNGPYTTSVPALVQIKKNGLFSK